MSELRNPPRRSNAIWQFEGLLLSFLAVFMYWRTTCNHAVRSPILGSPTEQQQRSRSTLRHHSHGYLICHFGGLSCAILAKGRQSTHQFNTEVSGRTVLRGRIGCNYFSSTRRTHNAARKTVRSNRCCHCSGRVPYGLCPGGLGQFSARN